MSPSKASRCNQDRQSGQEPNTAGTRICLHRRPFLSNAASEEHVKHSSYTEALRVPKRRGPSDHRSNRKPCDFAAASDPSAVKQCLEGLRGVK
jgi:hypothetical protein